MQSFVNRSLSYTFSLYINTIKKLGVVLLGTILLSHMHVVAQTTTNVQITNIPSSGIFCSGSTISLNITGGTAPYTITYQVGSTTVKTPPLFSSPFNLTVVNSSAYQAVFSLSTVTDVNNNYLQIQNPSNTIYVDAVPSVSINMQNIYPISCTNQNNPQEIGFTINQGIGQTPFTIQATDGTNSWNFTNITSNSSPIIVPGGTTFQPTIITDVNNCSATVNQPNSSITTPSGNLIISPSTSVSATCSYTLTLTNPTPGFQYRWYMNGAVVPSSTLTPPYTYGTISINAMQTGNYYVVGYPGPLLPNQTSPSCPDISGSVHVNIANTLPIPPTPSISVSQSGTLTCGQTVTLTAVASKQYDVYTWKKDGDIIQTGSSSTLIVSAQGNYQVSVTDNALLCGSSNFSASQTVSYSPPASFQAPVISGNAQLICAQTEVLSVNSVYDSYQWLLNNAEIPGATSSSTTISQAGYYTVRVTKACTEAYATVFNVTLSPIPVTLNYKEYANVSFNSGSNILKETTGYAFDTYQWQSSPDNITFTDIPGANQSSFTFSTINQFYRLKVTKGSCISYSDFFYPVLTNMPVMTPNPIAGTMIMCSSGANISVAPQYQSYQWYKNGILLVGETNNTITLSKPANGSGDYYVVITDKYGLVCTSLTSYVTVLSDITPVLQVENPSCSGSTSTITVSEPTPRTYYQNYIWKDPQGNTIASGPTTNSIYVATPGVYSVYVSDYAGCTATSTASAIMGTNSPDFTPIIQASATAKCLDANFNGIALSVSNINSLPSSNMPYIYTWFLNGKVVVPQPTPSQPNISPYGSNNFNAVQSGTYTLQISQAWPGFPGAPMPQGWNPTICIGLSNAIPLAVYPIPSVQIVSSFTGSQCPGSDVTVSATGNQAPNSTYTWNFGTATVKSGTGAGPYIISYPSGGNYQISTTVSASGCQTVTGNGSVIVNTPQPITLSSQQLTIYKGCSAQVIITSPTNNLSGWTPSTSINQISGQTNVFMMSPSQTTTYSITGTDLNNCQSSASVTIQVNTPPDLSFHYSQSAYCQNNYSYMTPIVTGATTNVNNYQSSAQGLTVNSYTGGFNPANNTPGTYTITNTMPPLANCPVFSSSTQVTINKAPVITNTFNYPNSGRICTQQGNISPNMGTSDPGTFTSSANGLVINPSTGVINSNTSLAGTYTITFTVPGNGVCTSTSINTTVTIQQQRDPSFIYPASTYCLTPGITGSIVPTLANASDGSNGFSVNNSGMTIVYQTGSINLSQVTAGTYIITNTYYNNGICPAVSFSESLTFSKSVLAASFSYSTNVFCEGDAPNISPIVSNLGTVGVYTVNPATGLTISPAGTITAVSTAGTYTITNYVKAGLGCTDSYTTYTITVKPKPILIAGTDNTCTGSVYTPSALNSSVTGTTYNWTASLSSGSVTGFSSGSGSSITQTLIGNGSVQYIITPILNGCTGNSAVTTTQINPIPVVSASATTACSGDLFSIPLSSTVTSSVFSWSAPTNITGLTAYPTTGASSSISGNATGNGTITYTFTGTAAGCISAPMTVVLTVNPYPVPSSTVSPSQVCPGATVGLSVATSGDLTGTTYTYASPAGFSSIGGGGGPYGFGVGYKAGNTSGNFTVTKSYKGCSITSTYPVTVYSVPTVQVSPVTICEGNGFSIPLNSNDPSATYTWSVSSTSGTVSGYAQSGTTNPIASSSITGNGSILYNIEAISSNNCISPRTPLTVTVNPNAPHQVILSASSVCAGSDVSISVTTPAGYNFNLTAPTDFTYVGGGGGMTGFTSQYQVGNISEQFTVNSVSSLGCTRTSVYPVTVNPLPDYPVINFSPTVPCFGQSGSWGYEIEPGMSYTESFSVSFNSGMCAADPGNYGCQILSWESGGYINLTATNQYGCSTTAQQYIPVEPTPDIVFTGPSDICSGSSSGLVVTNANNDATVYSWQSIVDSGTINNISAFNPLDPVQNVYSSTFTISDLLTGGGSVTYEVTATSYNAYGTCSNQNSFIQNVHTYSSPSVTISYSPHASLPNPAQTIFTANPVNCGRNPVYQWKVNGVNSGTNSSTYQNPNLIVGVRGTTADIVTCTVTSSDVCSNGATVTSNAVSLECAVCRTAQGNNIDNVQEVTASPNPFSNEITLKIPDNYGDAIKVIVTSSDGKLIETFNPTENTVSIGGDYASGMYLIQILSNTNNQVVKVIKEK